MKIGILGTRGIPNHHGGFEQFTEYFSVYAAQMGHEVYVYNSNLHPFKMKEFKGVNIIHCTDWEEKIGAAGQFVYDLNCILDARKRSFDVLLQLGYTSSAVWYKFLPKNTVIATNMDGLEWKRSKYSKIVQKFLKYSEQLAVKSSDHLISDSKGIQSYLQRNYQRDSTFIAYGANIFNSPDESVLKDFDVKANQYHMLIARMEPENNIETILDGFAATGSERPFLVIGNADKTSFGNRLMHKFRDVENIRFVGAVYNQNILDNLRFFSDLYFHGHSVGGTNPSLLEAMSSGACIAAHQNEFNAAILEEDAYYFKNSAEVKEILDNHINNPAFIKNNLNKIKKLYTWNNINTQYLNFLSSIKKKN